MPEYLIRSQEGCSPDPFLLPDSVLIGIEDGTDFLCDWALAAPPNNVLNAGGLRAVAELETAVLLLLFTDTFVPPDHPLAYLADGDGRGFWGDGVDVRTDLSEAPLGSLLWLLERAPLEAAGMPIEYWAQAFATEALAPLLAQGAVVEIDVSAVANTLMSRIELSVQLYGRNGELAYDRRFDLAWEQLS